MAKRKTRESHTGQLGILNPAVVIVVCVFALAILGVSVLFSASLPVDTNDPYQIIEKQALWMGITFVAGLLALKIDLEWFRKFIWVGYAVCVIGLVLVLIPGIGSTINGSRSWFRFGPFGLQIAEFAKIGLVFFLAHYFSLIRKESNTFWKGFVFPSLAIALVVGLIMIQTDLGTALIISMVSFCVLFLAGTNVFYLIGSTILGFGSAALLISKDAERLSRLTAFMDMEGNKAGDAYQVWQAILAFGAGGVDGVGAGNGRQQLRSLPEAHTDFIFAIVGEELGLITTLAVVLVFMTLFIAGISHLRKAPNPYQFLLASGCLLTISVQALVNLGVVTGSLPTTGLPLPFISYGGSNFLVMGLCVALILNTSLAWRSPALNDSKRKLKEI
ncbi:MAG: cell division protein FtsW [Opitutales bacterium]|jgi:cell division protein FtsW|nr:cell division protein FtsW [Opitutales bacterium]MBT5169307.1 cell division protein FtsW [Opitutales bacterium]MBT5813271.1 cell division protein FtsW [Opitutales bacterium]MBT6769081.1 cell division protein FtsW [Opitutales bacterium]MDG2254748.1 putative peptidoglycan glycosyltransferase FtsW [Opitutaceae bacterium]